MDLLKNNKGKIKKILESEGFFYLLFRIGKAMFFRIKIFLINLYLFLFKRYVVRKIANFNSTNEVDVFNFIKESFFSSFAPMQVDSEFLDLLVRYKEQKPKVVVEIGTARGGTLFCFSKLGLDEATLISIDLPGGDFGGGYSEVKSPFFRSFTKKKQSLFLLRGDSHSSSMINQIKDILKERKIDFLFIDGDHSYEGVKKDFQLYSGLVKNGGIIAFHDICVHSKDSGCEVNSFWDEIKGEHRNVELVHDYSQGWAGIGVIYL